MAQDSASKIGVGLGLDLGLGGPFVPTSPRKRPPQSDMEKYEEEALRRQAEENRKREAANKGGSYIPSSPISAGPFLRPFEDIRVPTGFNILPEEREDFLEFSDGDQLGLGWRERFNLFRENKKKMASTKQAHREYVNEMKERPGRKATILTPIGPDAKTILGGISAFSKTVLG